MKHLFAIALLAIMGCKSDQKDFDKYLKQLHLMQTPLVLKTIEFTGEIPSGAIDTNLFEKFKVTNASSVYGLVYANSDISAIIYTLPGDIAVPALVTYKVNGEKIDSLILFQNASGFGLDSELYERVVIHSNKTISVVDSLVRWDLNKSGDDRIEGSENVVIDSFSYFINKDGRIIKIRK